jgi:hypothetical protein
MKDQEKDYKRGSTSPGRINHYKKNSLSGRNKKKSKNKKNSSIESNEEKDINGQTFSKFPMIA